jgi:DNA-binding NarL/FixJ family response regulator
MSADTPLRVVIGDDNAFARRVTRCALQAAGMTVVAEAEAEDGREAVELALHHRPDVVVIDVVMPRLDGILATRRILEANPGQLVVVLTDVGEDELGLEALRAGAVEVVPKDADIDVLARALEGARREDAAISRAAG